MRKKILVTGSGGSAAVCFMKAIVDPDIELHAADVDPFAPGLYLVPPEHRHLIRRGNHPYFVHHLLALCAEHGIQAVVPMIDSELLPLARARNQFHSIDVRILVADESTLHTTLDKWELIQACAFDVPIPKTRLCTERVRWDDPFPCVVKPRIGSGSRGVYVISEPSALESVSRNGKNLIQEFLPGEEYAVDLYIGKHGSIHAVVPRLRLKVDAGVVLTSRTVQEDDVIREASAVAQLINLRGVASIQFRRDQKRKLKLLEVNPRFAGAMSLTVQSGVNIPQMAVDELFGNPLKPGRHSFQELGMVRTFAETYVSPSEIQNMTARLDPQLYDAPSSLSQPRGAAASGSHRCIIP